MSVEASLLYKSFGPYHALRGVSLRVARGELVALLGPSGCGKTTLLRVLAGLEAPDSGAVAFDGSDVTQTAARDRNVGFVFQSYALFEHMSVEGNVAFALRVRGQGDATIRQRVSELLERMKLSGLEKRRPGELSGGQRQRVAIARALAAGPRVLLLDEPFGALDARVRQELRTWLRKLHDDTHATTILVTHDRDDAFEIADRVVVMNEGRIEQVASPADLFDSPASPWVMRFLGDVNELPEGAFVRPHELELSREPRGEQSIRARIERIHGGARVSRVELRAEGAERDLVAEIDARLVRELALRCGEAIYASPLRVCVFPR